MLTIRCDGEIIATGSIGSRDVMYRDTEFSAPFIRPIEPAYMDPPELEESKRSGRHLCLASSPLFAHLIDIIGGERADKLVRELPPTAAVVTIRDEYSY